ncbi:MAG: hypothetical protein ACR2MM_05720 [Flavobacteriaceae bacterium]
MELPNLRLFILGCLIWALPQISYAQQETPCQGGIYELVDPFMGNWKEYTVTVDGEVFIGDLRSSKSPDGCTIAQRFVSADGSFSYQSFGYVEASSGLWKEVYVFSNGNNSEYQWLKEGEDVLMRRTGGTRQLKYMHQLRLTNIGEKSYDVIEEHSYDKGQTWEDIELTRIRKDKG